VPQAGVSGGTGRKPMGRPPENSASRWPPPPMKPSLSMIEAAGVEVVDIHAQRTGAHEWIHPRLLVEEDVGAAADLIRIIAADDTGAGRRVIGFADADSSIRWTLPSA